MKYETIKTDMLYRKAEFDRATADKQKRTIELSFSSELPVERYFGLEILDHGSGVDLSFLNSGHAPLLKDHQTKVQVGVVEKAWIGSDRKGRALVRFGKSELAEQEFQDVLDGIRINVSVGYQVIKMVLESSDENQGDTFRVMEWKPLEISIVSIPADETVGVGRKQERRFETEVVKNNQNQNNQGVKIMTDTLKENEIKEFIAIGETYHLESEALQAIKSGVSLESFRAQVLDKLAERNKAEEVFPGGSPSTLGLSSSERKKFSILRIVRALANPADKQAQEAAAFEFECSRAAQKAFGRKARGVLIPHEVLGLDLNQRTMSVGTDTAGGYLVKENLLTGSFIDVLRNATVVVQLGAKVLQDLEGDCPIPRKTSGATASWLGEAEDAPESQPALGQVNLSPKTVGAYCDLTRRLRLQASLDVEALIKADLAAAIGQAIDLAAISGSGASNEPLGILNTAGIGSVTLNAANTPDWGDVVDMEKAVAIDNALVGNLGYVTNATILGNLKQTAKESGYPTYIMEDGKVNGYPCLLSNQVPEKHIIFGNWNDILIGLWSGLDINVDTATLSKSGGVRLVVLQDVDIAIRHPESFCDGYKA